MAQAEERATGDFNHGVWWAKTAVEMATLRNLQMGKVCVSCRFVCLSFHVRAVVCCDQDVPPGCKVSSFGLAACPPSSSARCNSGRCAGVAVGQLLTCAAVGLVLTCCLSNAAVGRLCACALCVGVSVGVWRAAARSLLASARLLTRVAFLGRVYLLCVALCVCLLVCCVSLWFVRLRSVFCCRGLWCMSLSPRAVACVHRRDTAWIAYRTIVRVPCMCLSVHVSLRSLAVWCGGGAGARCAAVGQEGQRRGVQLDG